MPTPQKSPGLVHFTPETARAANAKAQAARRARAEKAAFMAAQAAAQPQLLVDNLTLAYSETLVMLRNAKNPQARLALSKAVEALKRAMESQGRRGITVVNPPMPSSTKPVLPPPRPVMPAGHRAVNDSGSPGGKESEETPKPQVSQADITLTEPTQIVTNVSVKDEGLSSANDDEGQGHPATW